jgi:hypothetical protein
MLRNGLPSFSLNNISIGDADEQAMLVDFYSYFTSRGPEIFGVEGKAEENVALFLDEEMGRSASARRRGKHMLATLASAFAPRPSRSQVSFGPPPHALLG